MATAKTKASKRRSKKPAAKTGDNKAAKSTDSGSGASGSSTVKSLDVKLTKVSFGIGASSVTATVSRSQIDLTAADRLLCNRRLRGRLTVVPNGDDPRQTYLFEGKKHVVDGTFDVKQLSSVKPQSITFAMTFATSDVIDRGFQHFGQKIARLDILNVEDIPAPEPKETKQETAK